jgi:hypothetical protein
MSKHIVCFSGGHSSALVAVEVARRFGAKNTILLNHNISPEVELPDIKRFKQAVADYLGIEITYANHPEWETKTPMQVCIDAGSWINPSNRQILCTNRLKTTPAFEWYARNYVDGDVVYFGFDVAEKNRITRRSQLMGKKGYKTDYPLALWPERSIYSTNEIMIDPPLSYGQFKHANCIGCLKAGWQHWYVIFCDYPHIWEQLKIAEESIGYPVHGFDFAEDMEEKFVLMKSLSIPATEHIQSAAFWAMTRKAIGRSFAGNYELPLFEQSTECTGDCRI